MNRKQSLATIESATTMPAEEICWTAVTERDAAYDGLFWYGVMTTGVYCRPSCKSRQPKRQNVAFFALPAAARQAGLRACLRCRPDETESRDPQADLVHSICRMIDESVEERPDLASLSKHARISQYHLQRLFKKVMGITPRQYANARRAAIFKSAIKSGQSVTDAMYEAGYGSSSRLYEAAAAQLGMTPATYGKGGRGMNIQYTTTQTNLGCLLVAATERGICSVTLGDNSTRLAEDLRKEFPNAAIAQDAANLNDQIRSVIAALDGLPCASLPLDVQGTAFQMRVWEELRQIPRGQTVSYGELASRIGKPSATRAVARACATNPVAILTPCHRVIRENGELGGYRWGIERKQAILAREKAGKGGQ